MTNTITIVGGGHGAGKTTFCRALAEQRGWRLLSDNAVRTERSRGVSRAEVHHPLSEQATQCFANGESFVFEHTMSGTYAGRLMDQAREHGFATELVYLDTVDVAHAVARIDLDGPHTDHPLEQPQMARCLGESRAQFWNDYRLRARRWLLFDTSGEAPVEIAYGTRNAIEVADQARFDAFQLRAERTDGRVLN